MGRDFYINGETLVKIKGNGPLAVDKQPWVHELGLASEGIHITPLWRHKDVYADDFGPETPAEVLWQLASVKVRMTMAHVDPVVLEYVMQESMGGNVNFGTLTPTGMPMGNGKALYLSGNHYMALNLTSPNLSRPWRFLASYLETNPLEIPVGTERSLIVLNWRVIPYSYPQAASDLSNLPDQTVTNYTDMISSGIVLWDRNEDFNHTVSG